MIAAMAVAAGAAFAETTPITSANIVGYETVTVESGAGHTFSLCLADIANPTQPVRIDKLFSSMEGLRGSNAEELDETIDQIWAFTGYVWRKYGYTKTGKGTEAVYAWKQWKNGEWIDLADTDVVKPGETFLYYHNDSDDDAVLTLAGQVKPFGQGVGYEIESGEGKFMAYPWPIEIKLNNLANVMTFENMKGSNAEELDETIDQIWVFTGYVWRKYGYTKTGKGTEAVYAWKQWKNGEWITLTDTDKVGAGEGFLYYHNDSDDAAVVTFKPLQAN